MPAVVAERQIAKRYHSSSFDGEGRFKSQRTEVSRGAPIHTMDLVCDVEPQRDQYNSYEHQLHTKDEQIHVLQRKLEHFRAWLSGLQGQLVAKDPQLLKNARRLYVGGIPQGTKEEDLRSFFEEVMNSTAATCAPGSSITSCKISSDKTYAFLEMRSVEEASNAMAFDGIVFKDVHLKIRRPSNYNAADALALGPSTPDPTVSTHHLPICKTVVEDSWNKIFVGGLPCNYTEEQVKELLQPYGSLKSFNLVMDKATGKSKGYAFCEFNDPRVIPAVINGLHMQCLERKVLTVKRALEGNRQGGGSKTMAPPLGTAAAAAGPGGGGSSSRLAAAASGSISSSSSSTALGFGQQQQQQQGYGTRAPVYRGPPATAAAAAALGPPAGRPMMPPHGDRHSPATAAATRGGDQGTFGGFYMPGVPESNSGYDVTGFGAGFGPGMPLMGPPSHLGFSGGGGGGSRGFGSSAGGSGYNRSDPAGFSGRGQNPEGHGGQGMNPTHEFPPPPGGAGYVTVPHSYHHNHHQQQQQQHGMMHSSGGSGSWNGVVGPNRSVQGLGGPVGHKPGGAPGHSNPRVNIPGVPPYNSPKQYSSNGGISHHHPGMANPSTPSPHPPTPPGAATAQLLALHCQPGADDTGGTVSGTVARSGSGAFGGTAAGSGSTAAAASPVAAITAPGSARLSPGIGGGAVTAAAALAGGPVSHPLAAMNNPHRVVRSSNPSDDQAVHHPAAAGLLPGSDPAAAAAAAAAVSSISSSGSLYHHDSLAADPAAAGVAAAKVAAAAPAGEDSGQDSSSTAAAAAADVLDS